MIEREDDIELLNDKNQQLRLKLKDTNEDNILLKMRVIELNDLIKNLSSTGDSQQSN